MLPAFTNTSQTSNRLSLAGLSLSLIALFLLIGSRYAYKVIAQRRSQQSAYSEPFWQQSTESEPAHHAIEKAVGAFAIAAVLALVYGCCSVI
ncbi:hypothetical protein [Pseudomonas sp. S2_F03]